MKNLIKKILSSHSLHYNNNSELDLLSADFIRDPYPLYKLLHTKGKIHKSKATGAWLITNYETISNALLDNRLGNAPSTYAVINNRNKDKYFCAYVANNIIPFIDPPDHSYPRKIIAKVFSEQLKSSENYIERICNNLLETCKGKKEIDILSDYATPLSISTISHILGVPDKDENLLKEWSSCFFYLFTYIPSEDVRIELDKKLKEFHSYFSALIEEKKVSPGNDFISKVISNPDLTEFNNDSLIHNCMLLFADGVENVDKGIANAVYSLLKFPDQFSFLKKNLDFIDNTINESLRYESAAQFIGRIAKENLVIDNQEIKKDDVVLLMLAAANRDPERIEQPDEFIINREKFPHLSFGKGRHSCIGAQLVKLEMRSALLCLFNTYPDLKLKSKPPVWDKRLGHRWLKELLIKT